MKTDVKHAAQAPVAQAGEAGDAVLRKHVLLMLDGMGEQVNATPSTPGNMVLQKGMRMAIGTAIDRVKSLPGAEESRTFMGEPVATPKPVGFVVLNHFGTNKHLFSSFYDTRDSDYEWAPVFADHAARIAFFEELRAIIIDADKPLGNRLQEVDARIALVTGAEQPRTPYKEPARYTGEGLTMEQILTNQAEDLINLADAAGFVVTIEQKPSMPLAMGNYETVASVRPARGAA